MDCADTRCPDQPCDSSRDQSDNEPTPLFSESIQAEIKKDRINYRLKMQSEVLTSYWHRIDICWKRRLKLPSILRFCSLFRHLIVLLIYIFYHLILSCRLNVRFNMQSCVHSFFCPTDRPTFTRGRAMGNETFYAYGLTYSLTEKVWTRLHFGRDSLHAIFNLHSKPFRAYYEKCSTSAFSQYKKVAYKRVKTMEDSNCSDLMVAHRGSTAWKL